MLFLFEWKFAEIMFFLQGKMCVLKESGASQMFCAPNHARSASGAQFAQACDIQIAFFSVSICCQKYLFHFILTKIYTYLIVNKSIDNSSTIFYESVSWNRRKESSACKYRFQSLCYVIGIQKEQPNYGLYAEFSRILFNYYHCFAELLL